MYFERGERFRCAPPSGNEEDLAAKVQLHEMC